MKFKNLLLAISAIFMLQGCCVNGYKEFYNQVAPAKCIPTESPKLFSYNNIDLKELYNKYFSDYLIIGESSFNGLYEDTKDAVSFAKKVGADVVLTTAMQTATQTSYAPLTTSTTYGTTTVVLPVRHELFDQDGMFLKKMSPGSPFWEKKSTDYKKTGQTPFEGIWVNEYYNLKLYLSGAKIVGCINKKPTKREGWDVGDVKIIFDQKSGDGLFFYQDRTPSVTKFSLNKFGHLVADDGSMQSFMRESSNLN